LQTRGQACRINKSFEKLVGACHFVLLFRAPSLALQVFGSKGVQFLGVGDSENWPIAPKIGRSQQFLSAVSSVLKYFGAENTDERPSCGSAQQASKLGKLTF
jgi:hypothetical protein